MGEEVQACGLCMGEEVQACSLWMGVEVGSVASVLLTYGNGQRCIVCLSSALDDVSAG